jgi:hypothetical protein
MASSQSGPPRPKSFAEKTAPPAVQQIVSLLLVLHLFCVALVVTAYTRASALQVRLLDIMALYTRTLDLAPAVAPYHLTQYDALISDNPQDDEHYLELEFVNAEGETEVHNLNEAALPLPDARRRYRTLASEMVYSMGEGTENENRLGQLARAAAAYGLRKWDAEVGVLRLKHHLSQPRLLANLQPGFPPDPTAEPYLMTSYEADVLLDDEGEVQLIKREAKNQVAPVTSPPRSPAKSPATEKGS